MHSNDSDSPFFEAVVTLSAMLRSGMISKSDMASLAYAYIRHSPVSRDILYSRLKEKKKPVSDEAAIKELVDTALKYAEVFQN
ncbi:Uncharacterised protein [uncultured archaeon]|nr:Uncharacterised protein [uncultured archaeon]